MSVFLYPHHSPPTPYSVIAFMVSKCSQSHFIPLSFCFFWIHRAVKGTGRFTFDIGNSLYVYVCLWVRSLLLDNHSVTLSAERLFLKKMCLFCCCTNRPNMYWPLWDCASGMISTFNTALQNMTLNWNMIHIFLIFFLITQWAIPCIK